MQIVSGLTIAFLITASALRKVQSLLQYGSFFLFYSLGHVLPFDKGLPRWLNDKEFACKTGIRSLDQEDLL